ncbi:carbon-nitrogen hydrolase family protein [uncultured Dysosmobacter sp.]|uniref:carbon-nitrogen hydrolase family protein n=1 Tax=uncultured Dysosmobacter sp. TaxID=2591384 RepID=UPI002625BE4B|nr:carbon-nitrogen hydrolase family protein [uncultured Dysosmobacter sp.]
MKSIKNRCKIAVVQAEPVMFDKTACIDKALLLINDASAHGAELIVFPELFIPGYPFGMNFGFRTGSRSTSGRQDWKRYYDNSILADGPEMQQLAEAAVKQGIFLSIGYSERDAVNGTLYNSNVMISPDGTVLNHRKLKPTGSERVIWGDADKDFFPIMETPWGPMGNLICWESYMPLARVALYEKGISLYISPNTNDNKEWQNTIRHIAIEGHCYFINCDMIIRKSSYPNDLNEYAALSDIPEIACRGGSCIIDPFGHQVGDCIWDEEGIIYADLDMQEVPASKMEHDVCGHYARPDVLHFKFED